MDSLERAPNVLSGLEGDAWGASREACSLLEDKVPTGEPPLDGEDAKEALPAEEAGVLLPWASRHSLALFGARRIRPLDKMILNSYVKLLE